MIIPYIYYALDRFSLTSFLFYDFSYLVSANAYLFLNFQKVSVTMAIEQESYSPVYNQSEVLFRARSAITGRYWSVVGYILLVNLIMGVLSNIPAWGWIAYYLLQGAFEFGISLIFLALIRSQNSDCSMLFSGFKIFGTTLAAFLLRLIFTLLWMLLLIIPGIIAYYRYSQTFFILASGRQSDPMEAINHSIKMMDGYKWSLFMLDLHFTFLSFLFLVPIIILAFLVPQGHSSSVAFYVLITLMVSYFVFIFFWLQPYWFAAHAAFFDMIAGGEPVSDDNSYLETCQGNDV